MTHIHIFMLHVSLCVCVLVLNKHVIFFFLFLQYINNIETDRPYRNWPGSVQDLLRPTYPGMLRSVKKNIYHLVRFYSLLI